MPDIAPVIIFIIMTIIIMVIIRFTSESMFRPVLVSWAGMTVDCIGSADDCKGSADACCEPMDGNTFV